MATLIPGDYSTAQEVVAFITVSWSGLLSLLASVAVVCHISQRHFKLRKSSPQKKPQNANEHHASEAITPLELRFQLSQAVVHILTSLFFVSYDYMIPQDFPDYFLDEGNDATCRAQGFMQQFKTASAYYSMSLLILCLWTMVHGISEAELPVRRPYFEFLVHLLALGVPLLTASVSAALNLFHPSSTLGCFYANTPLGCHGSSGVSCQDGTSNVYIFAWFFTGLPLLALFGGMSYILMSLYWYIRHLYQVVEKMASPPPATDPALSQTSALSSVFAAPLSPGASDGNQKPLENFAASVVANRIRETGEELQDEVQEDGEDRAKQSSLRSPQNPRLAGMMRFVAAEQDAVLTMALYVGAFVATHTTFFVCLLLDQTSTAPPFAVRWLHNLLWPAHAFLNFLIFLRPRVAHLQKQYQQHQQPPEHNNLKRDNDPPQTKLSYLEAAYCVILFRQPPLSSQRNNPVDIVAATAAPVASDTGLHSYSSHHHLHVSDSISEQGWNHDDANEARQLARAMSSRRSRRSFLSGESSSKSMSSTSFRKPPTNNNKKKAQPIKRSTETTAVFEDETPAAPVVVVGGTGTTILAAAAGRSLVASSSTFSSADHNNALSRDEASLDPNTYHATRQDARFVVSKTSSWSKLDVPSEHSSRRQGGTATANRKGSASSGESFGGEDDHSGVGAGAPLSNRRSSATSSQFSESCGSLVSFADTEPPESPGLPARDEAGIQDQVADTMVTSISVPFPSHTTSSQLDSVLEAEFEDSRADLSIPDLAIMRCELGVLPESPNSQIPGSVAPIAANPYSKWSAENAVGPTTQRNQRMDSWGMLSGSNHAIPMPNILPRANDDPVAPPNTAEKPAGLAPQNAVGGPKEQFEGMSAKPTNSLQLGSMASIRSSKRAAWNYRSNHSQSSTSWGMLGGSDRTSSTNSFAGSAKSFAGSTRSVPGSVRSQTDSNSDMVREMSANSFDTDSQRIDEPTTPEIT